jgi:3-hydroxyacyl-CoA dehydrogenase
MSIANDMERVAVVGAGGKMGRGISLLLAQEMTLQSLQPENDNLNFKLTLMDISAEALEGLKQYLNAQVQKYAQKNIESLKAFFTNTGEEEIVAAFVDKMHKICHPVTALSEIQNNQLIFEAVLEKLELKVNIFNQLKQTNPNAYFLSNTSSIPIHQLDEQVGLNGRIIGFHFYNPPAVQKLVELIIPTNVDPKLKALSYELGKRLKKIVIPANDVAGFIGNGHFMRDGLYGIHEAEELMKGGMTFPQSIYAVNQVTQNFLVRPMGIFQLIDYVGLDIFQSILKIMDPHFPDEDLHSNLIDGLVEEGVKGGQYPDGSQKDGFFRYEGNRPIAVYDNARQDYISLDEDVIKVFVDTQIGELPKSFHSWKSLLKDPERDDKLRKYFAELKTMETLGAKIAIRYLKNSKAIGEKLLAQKVANSPEDVNGVLMHGFFHLYGPLNDFVD